MRDSTYIDWAIELGYAGCDTLLRRIGMAAERGRRYYTDDIDASRELFLTEQDCINDHAKREAEMIKPTNENV